MASSLDLLILPLTRSGGQDQPIVPGLLVAVPPRRPARFRERDQLCLYLILDGNAPLSPDQLNDLLENLAKTYYRTTGSVTTAQRAVAESINEFLLQRNLRNGPDYRIRGCLPQRLPFGCRNRYKKPPLFPRKRCSGILKIH